MDTAVARQLVDKIYEKRKAAALELEKQIRECHQQGELKRIGQIIDQLIEMFSNVSNPLHIRNGGLIGLAGTAIALGIDIAPYMDKFIGPLLNCFVDAENRIRYFSAECLYNIAKVSKGEVLVYFNDIFDALSKLAADSELSVKNGAELLDRLLKDIVAESASVYIPMYAETARVRDAQDEKVDGVLVSLAEGSEEGPKKAFSLAHFIPLLRERIYVVSPFTRSYLASWITVLDSVPELELITYFPEFLDGLLKYLSDPTEDVRVAAENLLADFLRELQDVTMVSRQLEHQRERQRALGDSIHSNLEGDARSYQGSDFAAKDDVASEFDDHDLGIWMPGQGVRIDYAAIVEILLQQLDNEHDEIQQSIALRWLAEFVNFAAEVMVPFTPRLIPAILPRLAHHVQMIQSAANRTNKLLFNVIQNHPAFQEPTSPPLVPKSAAEKLPSTKLPRSPTPTTTHSGRQSTLSKEITKDVAPVESHNEGHSTPARSRSSTIPDPSITPRLPQVGEVPGIIAESRSHSPSGSLQSQGGALSNGVDLQQDDTYPFEYQAAVNELTVSFISEYEETRVSALKWLIMLHQKVPKKILSMEDGTFPALLKTLSDSSEEVIKYDLQLIAQISSSSDETYFKTFMINLLDLFSTDRRLLDARGSLIVRQLCVYLNTEKIYRTFAEILEKEEDLDFASLIIQKLNIILTTSPELAEFRRRLKSLETRQDGQALFTTLYRCWCHNAVAVFSLCLLAQAYEHASNLLYIFADLDITVSMLIQIDKLVQLIESPVFTYLRLQLLEPEKHPYLLKCLYGLLMLLPQSSAFNSLRNRLAAVNSAGYLQISPKLTVASSRAKLGRDEIKWQELLQHFRVVQAKHEKARRLSNGIDPSPLPGLHEFDKSSDSTGERSVKTPGRAPMRRRVTGGELGSQVHVPSSRNAALSPLNPKASLRTPSGLTQSQQTSPGFVSNNISAAASLTQVQKVKRPDFQRK
ncbi:ARM repeat-containing protein [Coprinopsis marcescibilis]|uniref:ARM repeat-containing protein n=1 Tax=Coprinopsis marcescibilis TaxID=230819 RepID=A0A5C3KWR5_COPMA|nr:ARM repeat-containing protein [Coprinopsis marcescibilis]